MFPASTFTFNRLPLYPIVTTWPGRSMRAISAPARWRACSTRLAVASWPMANCAPAALQVPLDGAGGGDIHTKFHSSSMRERLRRAHGNIDNHVMWTRGGSSAEAFDQMDTWLRAVKADDSELSVARKLAAHRPASLKDACWSNGLKYEEEQTAFGPGACNTFYPAGTTPRMAAGGPLTDDIAKCQLKPLAAADYSVAFTPQQWARLGAIFPEGVCDWNKPGVGQQALAGTWLSFGPSPVNLLFDITGQLALDGQQ